MSDKIGRRLPWFIGAVVGEFVMGGRGLGMVLSVQSNSADTTGLFATLAVLSVLAVAMYAALRVVERLTTDEHPTVRTRFASRRAVRTALDSVGTTGLALVADRLGDDVRTVLGARARVVERGALDGMTDAEIAEGRRRSLWAGPWSTTTQRPAGSRPCGRRPQRMGGDIA